MLSKNKLFILILNLLVGLSIYAQNSLPIIRLNGYFGYDYQDATVSLYMPDGTSIENMTGKIKWRGGTTNTVGKHKHNYIIKFNEDLQFFNMRKDNNWILDAGQTDLFRLRNRIATEIWNTIAHQPYYADREPNVLTGVRGQIVEVYLNDEYRGIYCLTECMDRKQLKLKKYKKLTPAVWDLDATVGAKWLGDWAVPDYDMNINHNLIVRLKELNVDDFNEKVFARYYELRKNILLTDNLIKRYQDYYNLIKLSGAADREKNKWSKDTDVNGEEINFEKEIDYITNWIIQHMQYLDYEVFASNNNSIDGITINKPKDNILYNINGQRINKTLFIKKGILIKERKKYIAK